MKVLVSIKRVVDLQSKDLNIDEYYKNFISNFYAIAFGGMVQSWLETNGAARMSSQELIHLLNITVSGNIDFNSISKISDSLRKGEAEEPVLEKGNEKKIL